MVYESDFYTTRRPYSSRPTISSYSVTTPRHYVVTDTVERPRRAEEQYSYSYSSDTQSRNSSRDPYSSVPSRSYSSSTERVSRSTDGGPGSYSHTTERSSRNSDYPGSYHSSYSSTSSGRLPHGTSYRHFSYRVPSYTDISRGYNIHTIPYVAHKRLVTSAPPIHTVRVRPSVILAEIDRINYKVRPSLAYQPVEDYLNSRSSVEFDDERRLIRAHTAALLRKVHEPLPKIRKPFPVVITSYDLPIPERITSDMYIQRLLGNTKSVHQDIVNRSYYSDAARRALGKGHLACVTFAGGRSFPRRRNLTHEPTSVKDDVTFLSHYERTREAANRPPTEAEAAGPVEQEQA